MSRTLNDSDWYQPSQCIYTWHTELFWVVKTLQIGEIMWRGGVWLGWRVMHLTLRWTSMGRALEPLMRMQSRWCAQRLLWVGLLSVNAFLYPQIPSWKRILLSGTSQWTDFCLQYLSAVKASSLGCLHSNHWRWNETPLLCLLLISQVEYKGHWWITVRGQK